MTTAVRSRPVVSRLREEWVPPFNTSAIDEGAGIIRNVKLCGLVSKNRRRYPLNVLHEAAPLYEGASVYFRPHTKDPSQTSTDPNPKVGWVSNVRVTESGLYGDLNLLVSHPYTSRIMEAARRNPRLYSISHDTDGNLSPEGPDGYKEVRRIAAVHCLDLVGRGATCESLFESHEMKTSLRRLIEGENKLKDEDKTRLLEMDADTLDYEFSPAGGDDSGEDANWKEHLSNAIATLIQSDAPEDHEIAKKILAMLHPGKQPKGDNPFDKETEDDDSEEDTDVKEAETLRREFEQMREQLAEERLRTTIRETLDELQIAPGDKTRRTKLTEVCVRLKDPAVIREHLELFKDTTKKTTPSSAAPPSRATVGATDTASFVKSICGKA